MSSSGLGSYIGGVGFVRNVGLKSLRFLADVQAWDVWPQPGL